MSRRSRHVARAALLASAATVCATGLRAQSLAARAAVSAPVRVHAAAPPGSGRSTAALVTGGIVGGALGALAGGVAGLVGATTCDDLRCFVLWTCVPMLVGESVGVATGVHVARRGRGGGRLALASFVSLGILAGGLTVAAAMEEPVMLVFVPVGQLAAAISIERHR